MTPNHWRDAALVLAGAFLGSSGLAWAAGLVAAMALGASFVLATAKRTEPAQAGPVQTAPEPDPVDPEPVARQRRARVVN